MIPSGLAKLPEFQPETEIISRKYKSTEGATPAGFNSEFMSLFQSTLLQNPVADNFKPVNHAPEQDNNVSAEITRKQAAVETSNNNNDQNNILTEENKTIPDEKNSNEKSAERLSERLARVIGKAIDKAGDKAGHNAGDSKTSEHSVKSDSKPEIEKEKILTKDQNNMKSVELKLPTATILNAEKSGKDIDLKSNLKSEIQKALANPASNETVSSVNDTRKVVQKESISFKQKNNAEQIKSSEEVAVNSSEKLNNKNKIKLQDKQNILTENQTIKTPENIVSRETISMVRDEKNSNQNTTADATVKMASQEKISISSTMKSDLSSDLSSNQNPSGFSMQQPDRMNFAQKLDESPVLRQNIQQQIDDLMQRAKLVVRDNGNARLSAKLNPKELGEINISLILVDGKLRGKFTVDNDVVQKEMQEKIGKLFSELKTEGYVIDSFQVDVRSQTAQEGNTGTGFLESAKHEFKKYNLGQSPIPDTGYYSNDITTNRRIYA